MTGGRDVCWTGARPEAHRLYEKRFYTRHRNTYERVNLGTTIHIDLREGEVRSLMDLLGGHPHLVRIALYHVARGMSLAEVLATAATDQGLFADHLKHLLWELTRRPELHEAARQVMTSAEPARLRTDLAFKLVSLGVGQLRGNDVVAACELYRRYLGERLPVHGSGENG
ncbi:AAA-like domain-containing protein [Sorangium sp. So ce381]|uniref:AAA-like domain-containing protein n=1 Tax=Sorangium sp. So ce381 TaxID=3133307 RepID=UPI003F5BE66B